MSLGAVQRPDLFGQPDQQRLGVRAEFLGGGDQGIDLGNRQGPLVRSGGEGWLDGTAGRGEAGLGFARLTKPVEHCALPDEGRLSGADARC